MLLLSIFSYDAQVFNVSKRLTNREPYYLKNINLVSIILIKAFILTFLGMGIYTLKSEALLPYANENKVKLCLRRELGEKVGNFLVDSKYDLCLCTMAANLASALVHWFLNAKM